MFAYFISHFSTFRDAFTEHVALVLLTLVISFMISAVIALFLLRSERITNLVVQFFGIIYSIPSLALFAVLIPVTGLGNKTAIIVLCAYNQFLLLRNIMTGLQNVDKSLLEAGTGMGMSRQQLLFMIQIPLAMPSIIAGIRLAIISTTGIATIAASINAGGLGTVLFSGLRTMNVNKLIWGTVLCVVIAFLADVALRQIEKYINQKNHLQGIQ